MCLACAMPGSPLCDPCARSLRLVPPSTVGGLRVEAAFRHVGAAARLVHNLKYRRSMSAGRFLAAAMVSGLPADATSLVPVPRSFVRRVTYGIDQAVTLASGIGRLTGLEVHNALGAPLWWRRNAGASRDRRHAVNFRALDDVEDGAVLIDDVFTTGITTLSAAAAIGHTRLSVLVATSAGTMGSGTERFSSLGGDVTQKREKVNILGPAARSRLQTESSDEGDVAQPRPSRAVYREEIV